MRRNRTSIETNIKRINNLDVIGTESINCNTTDDSYIKPDDKLCKETNITFEPLDNLSKLAEMIKKRIYPGTTQQDTPKLSTQKIYQSNSKSYEWNKSIII